MSGVFGAIGDFFASISDAVKDFVKDVWDEVVMPQLEEFFSWFGIEDETVIQVYKVSQKVYGNNTDDVIRAGHIRTVMHHIQEGNNAGYFANYASEMFLTKAQMQSYYLNGRMPSGYIHGLPEMRVRAGTINLPGVLDAMLIELGGALPEDWTILSTDTSQSIDAEDYFQNDLQSAPYNYIPYLNTLTADNEHGESFSDWTLDTVVFNAGPLDYSINISRTAPEAKFWIVGPGQINEGDSITCTVYCNRTVPAGKTVTIDFAYTGTAVDGTDYTSVASVVMAASTDSIDVVITTDEDAVVNGNRTVIVTIDNIDNSAQAFEEVAIHTVDSVTTTITDDDSLVLTMNDIVVNEADATVTIPVTLEAANAAFTVDYDFTDITALEGSDYTGTPGTLNFVGTLGEVQNIIVPITVDVADGDVETFKVGLNNCSDGAIDITRESTISIVDGSEAPVIADVAQLAIITKPNFVAEHTLSVKYHATVDPATEWYLWHYQYSAGTYTNIDPQFKEISNLSMLPVAILRRDGININVDETTAEYKTTRNLLRRLQINVNEFITNVDTNPDIDTVMDAYINFAINPIDTHPVIAKMLFTMWYELIDVHGITSNVDEYTATFSEQDVNNATVWTTHALTKAIAGTIGAVGDYVHTVVDTDLTLQHQTAAGLYDQIFITNLNGTAAVKTDLGDPGNFFHRMAVFKLGDDSFTIPVSWEMFKRLKHTEVMQAYEYIFRVDLNGAIQQEIDWYKTDAFMDLFNFAMIVLAVFTFGASLAVNGFWAAAQQLLVQFIIVQLVVVIAELTGNAELAAIVGIIATIAYGTSGSFDFSALMDPEILLQTVTTFADIAGTAYDTVTENIYDDIKKITEAADLREEEIKEAGSETVFEGFGEFIAMLKSVDSEIYSAVELQYSFNEIYNYDSLIAHFADNRLRIGVV